MQELVMDKVFMIKGLEFLGKGVNIFEEKYLEPATIGQIIDVSDGIVTSTPIPTTDVQEIFGSSYSEFIEKFAISAGVEGSYGGFSGSIETKFSSSDFESLETHYAQLSLISSGYTLSLGSDPAVLKRHLNADFKKALDTAKPEDLFRAYGTHVAVRVKTGGMISFYSYSKATVKLSERDFELSAKFKYKGLGYSVGANTALNAEEKALAEQVNGSDHLFVNGGETTARTAVEHGNKDSYVKWSATIEDHPGFLGFEQDGLFPVWELTDDAVRKNVLELAFRQMAARHLQIRIFSLTGPLASHPEAQVRIPKNYKMLSGGARDNWTGEGNLLTASFPSGDNIWVARGKDHIKGSPATMTTFAVAIYDHLDIWEVSFSQATGESGSHPTASVALDPGFVARGGVLVGGGAQVNWEGEGNLLTASYPSGPTTWTANSKDHAKSSPATITVYVIGVRSKVEGIRVESAIKHLASPKTGHPAAEVSPDSGYLLAGGGALVTWEGDGNLLTASYPKKLDTWAGSSKDHLKSSPAVLTAYAIGLKVT